MFHDFTCESLECACLAAFVLLSLAELAIYQTPRGPTTKLVAALQIVVHQGQFPKAGERSPEQT